MIEEIIKRIQDGPAVLFIGQNYLSLESGTNVFLKKALTKYGADSANLQSQGYNSIFSLGINKDHESILSWMSNLCKGISTPSWLEKVAEIPWSAVYTSAYDSVVERAFINEWRTVQPVTDEKYRVVDPRNKLNLHLTYLLGSIAESEVNKRPPFSRLDLIKRKSAYNPLLQKLPEIVTPRGILIFEGYDIRDQLPIEDLYPIISRLGNSQTIICGISEELKQNELISELLETGKLIAFDQPLYELISDWQASGLIHINSPDELSYYGKWLTINERKVKLPQEVISRVSKTATILDDKVFYGRSAQNPDDKFYEFRKFLSSTNSTPFWYGYTQNFAFKRDCYEELKSNIINRLKTSDQKEIPVILHGQSSSGKTTTLGLLAYELREELHCPVLFIEKRYQKVDEFDIDYFCQWAEDNETKNTVIIWDGMLEPDIYYRLLRGLNTRGRKVILIGSCYTTAKLPTQNENYIHSPIDLTAAEKKAFLIFLRDIDPIISNILSGLPDKNLLAMLYRYLPETRSGIKQGLKSEFDFFAQALRENRPDTETLNKGQLYEGLKNAGVIDEQSLLDLNETIDIDNETISLADQLIFSIMVPGKYGLNVPFELLLATIGYDTFSSSIFYALNEVNLIEWYEDSQGGFLLGARTAIEAKILTSYLGSKAAEVNYITLLLRNITSSDFISFGPESNPEIQFAVELLSKIGPNSAEDFYEHLYGLTEELRELREGGFAYHPRLILKEASFLREIIRKPNISLPEPILTILDRAEEIVRDALAQLENYQERTITTYLRVELAAILGTKIRQFIKAGNKEAAKQTYELIKDTFNYAFASNPENYQALDVFAWTIEELIKGNVFDPVEKLNAESELINLFEIVEVEGVSDQNEEDFYRRKLSFYELIGKQEVAQDTFEFLKAHGYASGYFLRAKGILGSNLISQNSKFEDDEVKKYEEAAAYLNANFNEIKGDGKCLFLLFKCWWISKSKMNFFAEEKQVLKFSHQDWEYCMLLINSLLAQDTIYQSATIFYIKGVAEFHLGLVKDSLATFRILDGETNFSSYGRRRIAKTYLSSNPDGTPKEYSGRVQRSVSYAHNQKRGDLFIPEIREFVPFLLPDFNKNSFQEGERIARLCIAFNFRGPIAIPAKN